MQVGFVGFGRVVEWHISCLQDVPGMTVSFVCDADLSRCERAKELLPNALIFHNINQLITNSVLDTTEIIVIATPTGSHYEIARKFLKNTDCTLLIEKPTFLRMTDYADLESYSDRIIPIFQNRFNQAVVKASELLRDLGCEISHASLSVDWSRPQRYYDLADWRGTWLEDGGVSTNQGIHYFDITRTLLGEFSSVHCHMKRRLVQIECEDYLSAYIVLNSDCTTRCTNDNYS